MYRGDRVTPTSSRGGSGEAATAVIPRGSSEDTQRQTSVTAVVEMSEDDLRRKTKSIVDEYLHLNDLKVGLLSIIIIIILIFFI